MVPMDEAYLLGGWFASALWGAYTVLFGVSMYHILTKRQSDLSRPTTWIMILMYSLATAHIFIALRRLVIALIDLQNKTPGPVSYLANIGDNLNRVKDLLYISNLILGDCIITWRCYGVWAGDLRIVALPVVMITGTAIAGYGSIGQYFFEHPNLKAVEKWGTAMFAISLATNIIVTLVTAGRIWYLVRPQKKVLGATDRRYIVIMLLLVESGAVIAGAKIVEFTLFQLSPGTALGNHPLYIVFEMMPQITGMMPTLIIAFVNAGLTSTRGYTAGNIKAMPESESTLRSPDSRPLERIAFHAPSTTHDISLTSYNGTDTQTSKGYPYDRLNAAVRDSTYSRGDESETLQSKTKYVY